MKVVKTKEEVYELGPSFSRGFVPTMGALHAGHAKLIQESAAACKETAVSIFVNPTQFAPHEDFDRYPRMLEADLELCRANGATAVFVPSVEEMYPEPKAVLEIFGVTETYEGAKRPHHFAGVTTVVAKLLNMVRPTDLFMGQKDLQQCSVIQGLIKTMGYPVVFHQIPTVREPDGLAMSSRNAYLSPEQRTLAPRLYQELCLARQRIAGGESDMTNLLEESRHGLTNDGFVIDYFDAIDKQEFVQTNNIESANSLIAAVYLGKVRLIDNLLLSHP